MFVVRKGRYSLRMSVHGIFVFMDFLELVVDVTLPALPCPALPCPARNVFPHCTALPLPAVVQKAQEQLSNVEERGYLVSQFASAKGEGGTHLSNHPPTCPLARTCAHIALMIQWLFCHDPTLTPSLSTSFPLP